MKFVTEVKYSNKDTADISSLVEFTLGLCNYSNELKIRYSFIIEETLLDWQESFDPDAIVTFSRYESRHFFRIILSIPGEKHNALADNTSRDVIEALVPRMKSGLGHEIKYRYRNGENIIILTLPKTRVEKTLFYTNLVHTSYPIITQRRLLSLSTIADTLMLSFFSQTAMSSASLVTTLSLIFSAVMAALSSAMTAIFSKHWGNRDFDEAGKTFTLTMSNAVFTGFIFLLLGLFLSEPIMAAYTNVPEIQVLGAEYLKTLSFYFLFYSASQVFICYMLNTGAVVRSSLYIIISQIFNCLMNAVLIFGLFGAPQMGIKGAALGTVLSSVLLFVMVFSWYMRKRLIRLRIRWFFRLEKDFARTFRIVTSPLLVREVLWIAGINVVSVILGHTNADVLAANAIATVIFNIFSCFYDGTASGCELIMNHILGMKRYDKASQDSRYIIRFSAVTGFAKSLVFALCIPLAPLVFRGMTGEAASWLRIMLIISVVRFFCAFMNATTDNGILLAGGDTRALTLIENFALWGLIVLPCLLGTLVFSFPVRVIVLLAFSDEILIFPFDHLRCIRGKWLEIARHSSE